jgi:hypothetical protein
MQVTNTILMVRPSGFRMNKQTAVNNFFQEDLHLRNATVNTMACEEFDVFVDTLRGKGIKIKVVDDNPETDTPDAIFPNNWISFHEDGTVGLYPMFAKNRRKERREDLLDLLEEDGFVIENLMDYTAAEEEGYFLEGTGSVVMDRVNRKAYCALSARADEELFIEFCEDFEYTPITFTAFQTVHDKRLPVYHTNVMMCVGEKFAVICLDAIDDRKERKNVVEHLKQDGKEIIAITEIQMHQFAGNMLQVLGAFDKRYVVMSSSAFKSLTPVQIKKLEKHGEILHSDLKTIETCGGGSARCMMAEVFLPKGS